MALFVQLDTNWPDNPKVIRVGLDGAGLHAMALCLAKRTDTDGVLHRTQLYRLGASDELIDLLIDEELFDPVEYGHRAHEDPSIAYTVRIHDWHSRNLSQSEMGARRSEAGRRGNHAKYAHPGAFEDCPKCSPNVAVDNPSGQVDVANLANDSQSDLAKLAKLATESESESESESASERGASDDGFDAFWQGYPRHKDRQRAANAWKRLRKADRAAALEALPLHAAAWKREHPDTDRFIPHAATWLNGRRWEDALKPAHRGLRSVGAGGVEVENAT